MHRKFHPFIKLSFLNLQKLLHYCIGLNFFKIVWLPNGMIFTDPTIAPKIAAKFVSPKRVRLSLLKQETKKVQILDKTEVGCLLDIDTSDNERWFIFFEF